MSAKILVVDDDRNLRESLTDNLELDGYDVTGVGSGQEALDAVKKIFFDVILMDFNLTDTNGIEAIREIRKVDSESKILMITAHGSLDTAVKAIDESVYAFLTKPVDFNYLKKSIVKALGELRLEQDNRRLLAELQRANNMKSKFMSMASHDLSNSLMTLQVSFELLRASITPNPDQKKRVDYIVTGISQLSRLIEDLVDWAAIEQGKLRFEKSPVSLEQMLSQVITGPQVKASMRSIELSLQVEPGIPSITADQRRITQVINNLLENAIRHTPSGGKIVVSASKVGPSEVQVAVADSGEGIAPEELKRIFESFYQPAGDNNAAGRVGRLGLGLSIAREIVVGHGGRIWAQSQGTGKGASFIFTLPVRSEIASEEKPKDPRPS